MLVITIRQPGGVRQDAAIRCPLEEFNTIRARDQSRLRTVSSSRAASTIFSPVALLKLQQVNPDRRKHRFS
jgi:hypothetical protein